MGTRVAACGRHDRAALVFLQARILKVLDPVHVRVSQLPIPNHNSVKALDLVSNAFCMLYFFRTRMALDPSELFLKHFAAAAINERLCTFLCWPLFQSRFLKQSCSRAPLRSS